MRPHIWRAIANEQRHFSVEGAGGKVISYYVTTGETDFLLISEANEAEAVIADCG